MDQHSLSYPINDKFLLHNRLIYLSCSRGHLQSLILPHEGNILFMVTFWYINLEPNQKSKFDMPGFGIFLMGLNHDHLSSVFSLEKLFTVLKFSLVLSCLCCLMTHSFLPTPLVWEVYLSLLYPGESFLHKSLLLSASAFVWTPRFTECQKRKRLLIAFSVL